jgi:cell division protein FtsZ
MVDALNRAISENPNILIVGLGGAGGNIVSRLAARFPGEIRTAAIDTDEQKLRELTVDRAVLIGESVTNSNSTGNNATLGRRAAQADSALIREVIGGSKLVIFVTGLGGGTGGGIAPVAARLAHSLQAVSITFATLPFGFEGSVKAQIAEVGLKEISATDTAVVQLPNQQLLEAADENIQLKEAFELSNEILAHSILSMWRLMATPGLINIDYGTIHDMLQRCGGHCLCVGVEGLISEGVDSIVARIIDHPLITRARLKESHGMILGITACPNVRFLDVEKVVNAIRVCLPADVLLRWGVALAEEMGDKISIVALCAETMTGIEPEELASIDPVTKSRPKTAKQGNGQIELGFVSPRTSGYFQQSSPTLHAGEDLDEPTYLRRNIRLPQ